jgi:hypothetical protein
MSARRLPMMWRKCAFLLVSVAFLSLLNSHHSFCREFGEQRNLTTMNDVYHYLIDVKLFWGKVNGFAAKSKSCMQIVGNPTLSGLRS